MRRVFASFVVLLAACETPTDLPPPPTPNAPGTISGQLLVSQSGTDNLIPAAGAKASIVGTSVQTTADSNGRFVLTPVVQSMGTVLLQADPNDAGDYERQQLVDFASIGAGPGHDATVGQVTLNPNATITGVVTLANVQPTTGLGDTTIFVPQGPFTTSTGDNGSFVFDNLPSGQITLAFFRQGYVSQVISGISLEPGQEFQMAPVVLQPTPPGSATTTGSISGQIVFVPAVTNPSQTMAAADGVETIPFTINADGTYSATLATGLYSLSFQYPNYSLVTLPNVLVSSGLTTSAPLVVMTPSPPGTDAGSADAGSPDAGAIDGGTPDAGAVDAGTPDGGAAADAGQLPVPPIAVITMTQAFVGTNNVFVLDGSKSNAPGEEAGQSLVFDWTQTFGTSVAFSRNNSAAAETTQFTAPETTGSLGFTLTVTDTRTMLTGQASATMTVILSPTANVTPPSLQATPGSMVTFNGGDSLDPNTYPLSYQWSSAMLDLGTATNDSAITFMAPTTPGTYALSLVVSDLFSSSVPAATAVLTVAAGDGGMFTSQPVARILTTGVVGVGAIAVLNGTDSQAQDEPPGQDISYEWTQVGGSPVTLSVNDSTLAGEPSFTAPATPQALEFTLVVTDTTTNLTGQATTVVQVVDPPVAVVTPSILQVSPGATATFSGSQSYDPSGNLLTYQWSSPVLALGTPTSPSISFTAPTGAGTYSVALQVDNGFLSSQTTLATLKVVSTTGAPTVNAGANQSVLEGKTVTLSATSTSTVTSWSWAQTAGTPVTLSGANTATATFTAPEVADVLVFQVTAATADAIATASTDVQVSLAAPLVSTPPSLSVATGSTVNLVATGASADTITYSWAQTAGSPLVTLMNAATATASFTAPETYAYLTFQVTATTTAGSATASVNVTVNGSSPPGIVQSDPASDGDPAGPWLMATATFNEALAPSSVTNETAFITDSNGDILAANVEYIAATQTVRVVPLVPLTPGQSYAVTIGGVTDEDPTPNVHATQTLHWTARPITWTTWTDSTVQTTYDPAPGVVADDSGATVVINETSGPTCTSYQAVFLSPQSNSVLNDSSACGGGASYSGEPVKRGFRAGGALYATGDVPHWGTSGYFQWQDSGGIHNFAGQETNGPPGDFFSDGSNIYMMSSNGGAVFYTCSLAPGGSSWEDCINVESAGNYNTQGGAFAGAASGSDVFVVGQRNTGVLVGFQLISGAWTMISGPQSDASIAHDNMTNPGTGLPRGTWAAGGPVFAWSDSASPDQINAAVLSTSASLWQVIPQINDLGAAAHFDIEGRGNVVLYAYVEESTGLLYLRELDLTNPTTPAIVALPGPAGATALNVNPSCGAGHPEISNTDGAIWITWSETCTSGSWTVQLRELQ